MRHLRVHCVLALGVEQDFIEAMEKAVDLQESAAFA
jgi:hypothetical protein